MLVFICFISVCIFICIFAFVCIYSICLHPLRLDGMMCAKVFTKGAAEIVLSMCDNQLLPDGSVAPMLEEDKQRLLASFGKDGRRYVLRDYCQHCSI